MTDEELTDLIARLERIKQRLFMLQSVWANTLSLDVAREADGHRELFRDLADALRKNDVDALDRITAGYESLLLAEPLPAKPTIPLETQQLFELTQEVRRERTKPTAPRPNDYVSDGLQRFV